MLKMNIIDIKGMYIFLMALSYIDFVTAALH